MKWNEVFCHTFKVLKKEIEPAVKKQVDFQKKIPTVGQSRTAPFPNVVPLYSLRQVSQGMAL